MSREIATWRRLLLDHCRLPRCRRKVVNGGATSDINLAGCGSLPLVAVDGQGCRGWAEEFPFDGVEQQRREEHQ
jgi:hypothetical protein